jgi:primosomal protein N' (replication factor Y)
MRLDGSQAAVAGLERDGLIRITRPLKGSASAFRTERVATITASGREWSDRGGARLGARQRELIDLLKASPDGIAAAELKPRGIAGGALTRLAALGLASIARRPVERDPFERGAALASHEPPRHELTREQAEALQRLRDLAASQRAGRPFQAALLHGVTGSGKTELYVRLAEDVRNSGRGVLLLVPEIALTPAVAAIFRAAFGDRVAIQHSGLSDGERHDQWHRIRRGDVDVVVGTRSAVFAPIASLGLVVVDEEHDGSFKQEESPRYNGRDVAIMRARQAGAFVVLGSATPSMESYQNAQTGR